MELSTIVYGRAFPHRGMSIVDWVELGLCGMGPIHAVGTRRNGSGHFEYETYMPACKALFLGGFA